MFFRDYLLLLGASHILSLLQYFSVNLWENLVINFYWKHQKANYSISHTFAFFVPDYHITLFRFIWNNFGLCAHFARFRRAYILDQLLQVTFLKPHFFFYKIIFPVEEFLPWLNSLLMSKTYCMLINICLLAYDRD